MVGLLPLLILRPFSPYTLAMPRSLTALSFGEGGIDGGSPLFAGDAAGVLYAPSSKAPNPIGHVPGKVISLRCLGSLSFVVAYAPPVGEERVELWKGEGKKAKRAARLVTLPRGETPLLALSDTGFIVGSVGGREVFRYDLDGKPTGHVGSLSEGVVGLATARGNDGATWVVTACSNGDLEAYGEDGTRRWRRTVPTQGRLIAFEAGLTGYATWISNEAGGRAGVLNLSNQEPLRVSYPAMGVVGVRLLGSGQPLLVGEKTVDVHRHDAPWSFDRPIVAADAGGIQVAVALADGTLIVRDPLKAWFRKGDPALLKS